MSDRPRVLHMGPATRQAGGMSAAISGLLESDLATACQLDFVATYRGPAPLGRLAVFAHALVLLALWSLRRRGRIVHVHATVRGSAVRKSICVLLARAMGRRVVLHIHSGAVDIARSRASAGPLRLVLLSAALAAADRIIVVSGASMSALHAAGFRGLATVIPNPAPVITGLDPGAEREDPVRAIYLGGFANPVKGGQVLVEALPLLRRSAPDLRLTFAGPGDPPTALLEFACRDDAVAWRGWLDPEEKAAVLRCASIFVMPSLSEGMPMALLEAMAYRLAIVATAAGGIPELVRAGEDGLLVPAGDPDALAHAVSGLSRDGGERRRLAGAAARSVRRFEPVVVAAAVAAVYRDLS